MLKEALRESVSFSRLGLGVGNNDSLDEVFLVLSISGIELGRGGESVEENIQDNIIIFPDRDVVPKKVDLSGIPTFKGRVSSRSVRFSSSQESENSDLPDFVSKMRKMASLADEIDRLEQLSSEMNYHLEKVTDFVSHQKSLK